MSGNPAIGRGMASNGSGSPELTSCHLIPARCGSAVTGCRAGTAGHGSTATGGGESAAWPGHLCPVADRGRRSIRGRAGAGQREPRRERGGRDLLGAALGRRRSWAGAAPLSADADRIKVETNGDTVILSGTVRSWAESHEAERATWGAPCVRHVENRLVVML
jgi:hypothetical protein